jgi:hypothetical protein
MGGSQLPRRRTVPELHRLSSPTGLQRALRPSLTDQAERRGNPSGHPADQPPADGPLGNIPLFHSLLSRYPQAQRLRIVGRELIFAI